MIVYGPYIFGIYPKNLFIASLYYTLCDTQVLYSMIIMYSYELSR